MAVDVVAAVLGTEHRGIPGYVLVLFLLIMTIPDDATAVGTSLDSPPVVGDEVADEEVLVPFRGVEEDEAVPGVEDEPVAAVVARRRAEGRGGDEAGDQVRFFLVDYACPFPQQLAMACVEEEAQHGRRPVEGAVLADEVGVGEDAVPARADGGGATEGPGVVRGGRA